MEGGTCPKDGASCDDVIGHCHWRMSAAVTRSREHNKHPHRDTESGEPSFRLVSIPLGGREKQRSTLRCRLQEGLHTLHLLLTCCNACCCMHLHAVTWRTSSAPAPACGLQVWKHFHCLTSERRLYLQCELPLLQPSTLCRSQVQMPWCMRMTCLLLLASGLGYMGSCCSCPQSSLSHVICPSPSPPPPPLLTLPCPAAVWAGPCEMLHLQQCATGAAALCGA
jgi:hypothetical protein